MSARTMLIVGAVFASGMLGGSSAQADLIHHWRFDESSGTTAFDSAGSLHGAMTNGAAFLPAGGVAGGAGSFDGADDHVLLSGGAAIMNTSFSVSMWLKRDTTNTADYALGQGDTGTQGLSLHIGWRDADTFTQAFWGDDQNYNNATLGADTTNFHHFLTTFDAGINEQRIYADGVLVATRPSLGDFLGSGANNMWIGRRRDGNNFDGLIDDVQIYNHTLTASDAAFLFANPGVAVAVPEPSTVLYVLAACGGLVWVRRRQGSSGKTVS